MRLRSGVAVAVVKACSCSSESTPSLGTSICHKWHPKKRKRKTEQNNPLWSSHHGAVEKKSWCSGKESN